MFLLVLKHKLHLLSPENTQLEICLNKKVLSTLYSHQPEIIYVS